MFQHAGSPPRPEDYPDPDALAEALASWLEVAYPQPEVPEQPKGDPTPITPVVDHLFAQGTLNFRRQVLYNTDTFIANCLDVEGRQHEAGPMPDRMLVFLRRRLYEHIMGGAILGYRLRYRQEREELDDTMEKLMTIIGTVGQDAKQ